MSRKCRDYDGIMSRNDRVCREYDGIMSRNAESCRETLGFVAETVVFEASRKCGVPSLKSDVILSCAPLIQILHQLLQMEPPIGHTLLGVLQIEMIQISLVFGPFQQILPLGTILSVDGA